MPSEDTDSETITVPFPGYDTGEALGADLSGHRILGLKPMDIGVAVVRISYSGVRVLVNIHVKKIAGFSARDFPQMQLYPGHLSDSSSISYTIFNREVRVSLTAVPAKHQVIVRLDGDAPIKSYLPQKPIHVPYLAGPYPFPDISGLKSPKSYSHDGIQGLLNRGKWYDQKPDASLLQQVETKGDDAHALVTMLGGDAWLTSSLATLSALRAGADSNDPPSDLLVAMGGRVTAKSALAFDKGVGFFFGREYFGLFMMGQASIGVALEIGAEFVEAFYWGADDTPGSALEAFKDINGFVSVSAGDGLEFSADFVFSDKPKFRLCGLNFGIGAGAGFSVAAGVQKVAAGNYVKP